MKTNIQSSDRSHSQTHTTRHLISFLRRNKVGWSLLSLGIFFGLSGACLQASDPIGVFALVDKVALEPNTTAPERIQVWGSFCLADDKDPARYAYKSPPKGYLYYKLPDEKTDAARKEWKDLAAIAGTGQVIGFGSRFAPKGTVRSAGQKPENPDVYSIAFGLVKSNQRRSDYGPIKQLLSLPHKEHTDGKGKDSSVSAETKPKKAGDKADKE
ncbi:MAG: hypothetical protein L0Z50_02620 [Verrucomicrobiales bacterium]|nr:hypothetical protein [Verrucomicrobiales bacterium]